jgi:pimeloyl-ACP methyl ester carboxylesterase
MSNAHSKPRITDASEDAHILTLSGWTQPSHAIADVIGKHAQAFDYSAYASPQQAIEALGRYRHVPHVVAWSMGGLLVVRAIAEAVLAPQKLTLIAPPYQFVSDDRFSHGMPPHTFTLFRDSYAFHTERTKARFHGLVAKGDARMREVMAQLYHHHDVDNVARWLPWLDDLGRYSHFGSAHITLPPTQLIQGTDDAIVPKGQADAWAQHYPEITLHLWHNAGHAPHLHDKARFLKQVREHHGE